MKTSKFEKRAFSYFKMKAPSIWKEYSEGKLTKQEIIKSYRQIEEQINDREAMLQKFAREIKNSLKTNPKYVTDCYLSDDLEKHGIRARIHYELIEDK